MGTRQSPSLQSAATVVNLEIECSKPIDDARSLDFAFILCKLADHSELLPGWTGFNTSLCAVPDTYSRIGYLPVIDAPVTDMATIYTILRKSLDIINKLKVRHGVMVFDEAVYAKIQQVRWKTPEFVSRFVVRLGEFHASMSYMSAIGKRFEGSGFKVRIRKFIRFCLKAWRTRTWAPVLELSVRKMHLNV